MIILDILQSDCKKSMREIAKLTQLPISTVFTRVKKLENKGIIQGYKAKLNREKLGYKILAFILVSYKPTKLTQEEVARKISQHPQVQEVHIIAGEWDILIKVVEKSIENLGDFVVNNLRSIEGVEKTLTCIVLKEVKETDKVPTIPAKFRRVVK